MITVDFSCLALKDHGRILDIGCGSGRHTAAAYDSGRGWVIGADPNLRDLREAQARLNLHTVCQPRQGRPWSLTAADIIHLPFKSASFDTVICAEVLEHIAEHRQAVRECIRVLKPGGQLVVSVPRRWPEAICWALSKQYRHTPGGHIRIYHARRLIRLICSSGLALWRKHYAHGLHAPYWWLKCLLGIEREHLWPVTLYQRFLTWEIMQKPRWTRRLERRLNPVMGKSVVLYFSKPK